MPFNLGTFARELPRQALSTCAANPFSTETVIWPIDRGTDQAKAWLDALPPSILRVKGSLSTPEGRWQVERTVDSLEIHPADASPHNESLVLIAHDDHEPDLEEAARSLL